MSFLDIYFCNTTFLHIFRRLSHSPVYAFYHTLTQPPVPHSTENILNFSPRIFCTSASILYICQFFTYEYYIHCNLPVRPRFFILFIVTILPICIFCYFHILSNMAKVTRRSAHLGLPRVSSTPLFPTLRTA